MSKLNVDMYVILLEPHKLEAQEAFSTRRRDWHFWVEIVYSCRSLLVGVEVFSVESLFVQPRSVE